MNKPAASISTEDLRKQAREELDKGAVVRAMQTFYELHQQDPDSVEILNQLVALNLHLEMFDAAIVNLKKLTVLEPENASHFDQLAGVYGRARDYDQACEAYYTLLARKPRSPVTHFNLAYYLRRAGRFEDAVENYKRALGLGIDRPEEVHLNIAVILSDDLRKADRAEKHLLDALSVNEQYSPAMYNLANLYEDRGNSDKAAEMFEKILSVEPQHPKALARLVAMNDIESPQDPLVARLYRAGKAQAMSLSDKIDVFYSLGKAHDDCAEYDLAFQYYATANQLNAVEMTPYDRTATESLFDRIIQCIDGSWLNQNTRDSEENPIFICGMFRSGSTLVEQVLAAHPKVTAGGERDTFVRAFSQPGMQFPGALANMNEKELHRIARRYSAQSESLFPGAQNLTDKRPDNFLYLGVVKALFPKARFIYTTRHPLDNCLSVWFVRLGKAMNYAVNLETIAHYHDQQARLLDHWKSLMGEDLHVVHYDELIRHPRRIVEEMLQYLGLELDENCLDFHRLKNTVKTASVCQVRQPLYTGSSGRWRNYEGHIGNLIEHFGGTTSGR